MNKPKSYLSAILMCLLPLALFGQASVTGTVTDARTGGALAGANVIVEGTDLGAAADASGRYIIGNVPAGTQTITASVIGYDEVSRSVNVPSAGSVSVDFALESAVIELSALEVLANRATRETPVAFSNVEKEEMELRLGSQDIPLVLNTTPGVYATQQGGGAGDARFSIRGFNQRNVAIMINGVPTNDMENAWLYWSNWDGLGDASSSIQVQRGLSAVNLATPSIGGTMNIISDPASRSPGFRFKQEVGSWGFLKSTFSFNSGLMMNDKLAFSGNLVKKTGDGYYKGTWTDAYAFYLAGSYALTKSDRFELYAIGAPQRHGQNRYRQNIARYSHEFAEGLDDYDEAALEDYAELGRDYNQNYDTLATDSDYDGKQYWQMYTVRDGVDRFDKSFLNEVENYFHKPQVNLNWYHTFTDQMRLSTVVYWSGGKGGGTGTYGSVKSNRDMGYARDWDAEVAENTGNIDTTYSTTLSRSTGILRNSVNQQWTIGAISKLYYDLSDAVRLQGGLDWRTAEIGHWREVRDLLGGDYYADVDRGGNPLSEFWTGNEVMRRLGDKINYNFTNTVDWLGAFGQGEYRSGPLAAYGMFGWSSIAYTYTNHFFKDDNGDEIFSDPPAIATTQFKGGASFRLAENLGLFGNFGVVSKPPIFDHVIDDYAGVTNEDPQPESFTSIEGGTFFAGMGGRLTGKANFYYTIWNDRTVTEGVRTATGEEGLVNITGLNATHSGVEVEGAYQPMSMLRLNLAASFGNWVYTDDVFATYRPDQRTAEVDTVELFIKDLKVGDAPQTQIALSASVFPIPGLTAQVVLRYYANHYADFDPLSRTTLELDDNGDRIQSWLTPSYSVVDLHGTYDLPVDLGRVRLQAFFHVFNALDEVYIQDALDNSAYNAYGEYSSKERRIIPYNPHSADAAEVFFGLPRNFNAGLIVNF